RRIFEDRRSGGNAESSSAGWCGRRPGDFNTRAGYPGARIFVSLGRAARYAHESRLAADSGRNCELLAGERTGLPSLQERRREGFTQNRQSNRSRAADPRHRTSGNGCGRGAKSKGKAETASRDKNVSGAADSGESRRGGTRAVSFADPCHFSSWRTINRSQLPLTGRSHGETRIPASCPGEKFSGVDQESDSAGRRGDQKQSAFPERKNAGSGENGDGGKLGA